MTSLTEVRDGHLNQMNIHDSSLMVRVCVNGRVRRVLNRVFGDWLFPLEYRLESSLLATERICQLAQDSMGLNDIYMGDISSLPERPGKVER